jgi:Holliday junction resolvase-like predicted endonuclease
MKHRGTSDTSKRHQVFLSYAKADEEIAQRIADELRWRGISVWFDVYELKAGDSIAKAIEDAISASDYLIVLLSPNSVNSVWVQKELAAALSRDLSARDITLLPVVIADCDIPLLLASYQLLDLRRDFEAGVTRLVEQIGVAPEIDFSELDGRSFENLVVDLLSRLGFTSIEREWASADMEVDIKASYARPDPFRVEVTETWLVEVKFYRQARADLKSIRQLVEYLTRLPAQSKGLLVTNGQLTSAAKDWLNSAKAKSRVEIRVIDGTELKRLLLQHGDLVSKYFVKKNTGQQDE